MMKARTRGKEILKVALISVLSVALFGAGFIGFNRVIFAAATAEPTPLSQPQEVVDAPYEPRTEARQRERSEQQQRPFIPPALTVFESAHAGLRPAVPAVAMSMEEAAQIGARYIWDVFGASIDGMYVEMFFSAHPSQSRSYWSGAVREEAFVYEYVMRDNLTIRAHNDAVLYQFRIDAVTGMRVDIISTPLRDRIVNILDDTMRDNAMSERYAMLEAGWFEMNVDEQLRFLEITLDDIADYISFARYLAGAHFGEDYLPGHLYRAHVQLGDDGLELSAIEYSVTFGGREANIFIPTSAARTGRHSITTSHNDFIPGFEFNNVGGRG